MKPMFKCDYCSKMGTEEEIREHELVCMENYDRRSCHTCEHKKIKIKDDKLLYECKADCEIPEGQFFEFCRYYERKEKTETIENLFSDLFGFGK